MRCWSAALVLVAGADRRPAARARHAATAEEALDLARRPSTASTTAPTTTTAPPPAGAGVRVRHAGAAHVPGQPDPQLLRRGTAAHRAPRCCGATRASRAACAPSRPRATRPARGAAAGGPASRRCSSATGAPGWCSAPTTARSTSSTTTPGEDILPPFETGDIIKGSVSVDPDGLPLVYTGSRDNKLPRDRHRPARADRAVGARRRRRQPHHVERRLGRLAARHSTTTCTRAARTRSSTSSSSTARPVPTAWRRWPPSWCSTRPAGTTS